MRCVACLLTGGVSRLYGYFHFENSHSIQHTYLSTIQQFIAGVAGSRFFDLPSLTMSSQTERDPSILFKLRSSLACVPCRSRHIKCDANKPTCVRCEADGRSCHYVQSRRGLKYRTSPASLSEDGSPVVQSGPDSIHHEASNFATMNLPHQNPMTPTSTPVVVEVPQLQSLGCQKGQRSRESPPTCSRSKIGTYLDLYYSYFHPAHPYLLPRRRFDDHLWTNRSQLEDLLVVLEFIASTYSPDGQSAPLKQRAIDTLSRHNLPLTGFTVQALVLLAITVHCCNGFDLARSLLDKSISIALEIGMQFNIFAVANGNGDSVLEESWRRTWWALYIVDGVFEVIVKSPSFTLWNLHVDVDLPCEERDYNSEVRFSLQKR